MSWLTEVDLRSYYTSVPAVRQLNCPIDGSAIREDESIRVMFASRTPQSVPDEEAKGTERETQTH
jgi:hypothetical protein